MESENQADFFAPLGDAPFTLAVDRFLLAPTTRAEVRVSRRI